MRERHILDINNFKGVDLSSPALEVDKSRAIDCSNLIKLGKSFADPNEKRSGWEQVGESPQFTYYKIVNDALQSVSNPTKINSIIQFYAEDNTLHVVAHIGYCLFEIKNISDYKNIQFIPLATTFEENSTTYQTVIEMVNEKTQMFAGGNRLYILGGTKFLCLRFYINDLGNNAWELFAVEDSEHTYIPTTTNQITYADSPVSSRTALDDVNLLHTLRKNKCISGTLIGKDDYVIRTTKYYEYQLDTNINFKPEHTTEDIEVNLEYR